MTEILRGRNALGPGSLEVVLEGDRISSIARTETTGATETWIGPGLVDLQVNGSGGGDANADHPSPENIVAMARSLASHGTTRFLPTVITASADEMLARITAIAAARSDDLVTRMVAGIHIEGPSLSEEDGARGVHPVEHLRAPSTDEAARWLEASAGLLRIVTFSPHFDGSVAFVHYLVQNGVRVAIGHTHADERQIHAAVDAGASLSTHLGNGAHRTLPRHPNYLWTQLAEPRLTASVIADGHHLPDSTLSTILAAKRPHGSLLVSDAVATPAALSDGISSIGGSVSVTEDGALRHRATGLLAGSIQALDTGVATVARVTGDLNLAVSLASQVPSQVLDERDPWRVGARADVLLFRWGVGDRRITPSEVYIAGRRVH